MKLRTMLLTASALGLVIALPLWKQGKDVASTALGSAPMAFISTAHAGPSCAALTHRDIKGLWTVLDSSCVGACVHPHVDEGDVLQFKGNPSTDGAYSMKILRGSAGRPPEETRGYTIQSDGVAAVKGDIDLEHDAQDGRTPGRHWVVARLQSVINDDGSCGRQLEVQVCESEPEAGSYQCAYNQHNGLIHAGG
ncbi:MAG: hypothetical protein R3E77_02300 [Steroidobacteraceae bacterium]